MYHGICNFLVVQVQIGELDVADFHWYFEVVEKSSDDVLWAILIGFGNLDIGDVEFCNVIVLDVSATKPREKSC